MTSSISFRQAAQAAVGAVEAAIYPPSYKQAAQVAIGAVVITAFPPIGVMGCVSATAAMFFGFCGVEFLDSVREAYVEVRNEKRYSVMKIPRSITSPKIEEIDTDKIDAQFKQVVQRLYNSEEITDDIVDSTLRDALDSDKTKLLKDLKYGCCYGAVSSLFHEIEKNGLSIEQSALNLTKDDAYFRQVLQAYGPKLKAWYESEKLLKELDEQKLSKFQASSSSTTAAETENDEDSETSSRDEDLKKTIKELKKAYFLKTFQERIQAVKKLEEEMIHLKEIDPLHSPMLESSLFAVAATPQSYRYVFEKTTASLPKNAMIRGVILTPGHRIGFQFAPKEYYIYDTYKGALLKFSDQELCFTEVRTSVLKLLKALRRTNLLTDISDEMEKNPKMLFQITHVQNAEET